VVTNWISTIGAIQALGSVTVVWIIASPWPESGATAVVAAGVAFESAPQNTEAAIPVTGPGVVPVPTVGRTSPSTRTSTRPSSRSQCPGQAAWTEAVDCRVRWQAGRERRLKKACARALAVATVGAGAEREDERTCTERQHEHRKQQPFRDVHGRTSLGRARASSNEPARKVSTFWIEIVVDCANIRFCGTDAHSSTTASRTSRDARTGIGGAGQYP
jgi:hypothetical protein